MNVCITCHCDQETCCKELPPPCTTVTTTPMTTVTTTPLPTTPLPTTTLMTTVTTTPLPTTPAPTTTPMTTVTTTPLPTTPLPTTTPMTTVTTTPYVPPPTPAPTPAPTEASPCAPVVPVPEPVPVPVPEPVPVPVPTPSSPCETAPPTLRKYDGKKAILVQQVATPATKESNVVPAWAFPLFGVVAMFSFAAFVTVRVRGRRSTRQVQMVQPVSQVELDEESLLSDDAMVE